VGRADLITAQLPREDELAEVLEWARQTRISTQMLEWVLAGKTGAFMRNGEMIWKALQ
jgi:uncharacterized protein YbaP (TraB family)